MLGQFKRGKSTLLNALLGVPLLPTGITPVTSIPTYVRAARDSLLRIEFDSSRPPLVSRDPSEFSTVLARYVAEAANVNNREQVRCVEIALDAATFSDRVVLVDTPGVGSTFLHNSRTAEAVLNDCDVGIFVLSPDPPITEVELGYLDNVRRLIPKVFFAFNKVDLLSPEERDVALSFLANVLEDKLGPAGLPKIFPVSARVGLSAKREGNGDALAASGVLELEEALASELASEERAIAFATGRSRAVSLVGELLYRRQLEHKALMTPEQALVQKIREFETGISRFESAKVDLSDVMAIDRRRLLTGVEATTDRIWTEARSKFAELAKKETPTGFDETQARAALGTAHREALRGGRARSDRAGESRTDRQALEARGASDRLAGRRAPGGGGAHGDFRAAAASRARLRARAGGLLGGARASEFHYRRIGPRARPLHADFAAREATAHAYHRGHGKSGVA